jgi:hypothetical protein
LGNIKTSTEITPKKAAKATPGGSAKNKNTFTYTPTQDYSFKEHALKYVFGG